MSLVTVVRAAPEGNTRVLVSAGVGRPPLDQLPGLLNRPFTAPLQVCDAAEADWIRVNANKIAEIRPAVLLTKMFAVLIMAL